MKKRCYRCGMSKPATKDYFHLDMQRRGDQLRGICINCVLSSRPARRKAYKPKDVVVVVHSAIDKYLRGAA